MGYRGGRLAPWYGTTPVREGIEQMAAVLSGEMLTLVVLYTPVDTGRLKTSWHEMPQVWALSDTGERMRIGGVQTEVDYAPFVEWDTKPHIIRPKNPGGFLSWIQPGGGRVYARIVHHPGTKGAHMAARAVHDIEATFGVLIAPIVHETCARIERQNHTGLAVGATRGRRP